MKKIFLLSALILTLALVLTSCFSFGGGNIVDLTDSVEGYVNDDHSVLTGYEGNAKNISIPNELNGKPIGVIKSSFAQGKEIKSVELPQKINSFLRDNEEIVLCVASIENSISINPGNAAAVFCGFFNTDKVTVNGVDYSVATESDAINLEGEWKNVDIIAGKRYVQTYVFNNGAVTCTTSDGDVFNGTYTIENGNLFVTLDDVTAKFEQFGDTLVCWEYNITLSTKELSDYTQETNTDWDYIVTSDGKARLVGYKGSEQNVQIPSVIDGYEIGGISSKIADSYNFTEISYSGVGGIPFASEFYAIYFDPLTEEYVLAAGYGQIYGNGFNLRHNYGNGNRRDYSAAAYCKVFGVDSLIIDGKTYSDDKREEISVADIVGNWSGTPEINHYEMIFTFYENGLADVHCNDDNMECVKCRKATYEISGTQVIVNLEDGTVVFDYLGGVMIVWAENDILLDMTSALGANDFTKIPIYSEPHITENNLLGRYELPLEGEDPYYVDVKANGEATVTLKYCGWVEAEVSYTFDGNELVLTDGEHTEIFTLSDGKLWFIDQNGNYFDKLTEE